MIVSLKATTTPLGVSLTVEMVRYDNENQVKLSICQDYFRSPQVGVGKPYVFIRINSLHPRRVWRTAAEGS